MHIQEINMEENIEISTSNQNMVEELVNNEPIVPVFDFKLDFDDFFGESGQIQDKDVVRNVSAPAPVKKRFASLSSEELDSLVVNSQAKKTKYATNWGVSIFEGKCSKC